MAVLAILSASPAAFAEEEGHLAPAADQSVLDPAPPDPAKREDAKPREGDRAAAPADLNRRYRRPVKHPLLTSSRWVDRPLLVFTPERAHPDYEAFDIALRAGVSGLNERDMRVFRVFEAGVGQAGEVDLLPGQAEELRALFSANPGALTVVLIGKDGLVKLQEERLVGLSEIFRLVDSMPMRQREVLEAKEAGR